MRKSRPCKDCGDDISDRARQAKRCAVCARERQLRKQLEWQRKNKRAASFAHIKHRYGLTREGWEALHRKQNGGCAICGDRVKLVVDHDHTTGKVRGLLCRTCNSGLGQFYDNPERLRSAAEYLEDA